MNLDLIIFLLIILCLYRIKLVRPTDPDYENYLSPERTNAIKGIFAYMVVCYHLSQYLTSSGLSTSLYRETTQNGYLYVCPFFFYSGFGLMKKTIDNPTYIRSFFSRRIRPILITYALVHLIYIPAFTFTGRPFSPVDAVVKLLRYGATYTPHSWYILAIVIFYLMFWLLLCFLKTRYHLYPLGSALCYLLFVFLCRKANYPTYWYDSCSTFVLGVFWAYKEDAIFNRIKQNYFALFLPVTACFLFLYVLRGQILAVFQGSVLSPMFYGVLCILFTTCLTLLSVKLNVNNKLLQYLGKLSLTLYLLHGLYVSVFDGFLWALIPNEFLRCFTALALSIFTAACYSTLETAVKRRIGKRKRSLVSSSLQKEL